MYSRRPKASTNACSVRPAYSTLLSAPWISTLPPSSPFLLQMRVSSEPGHCFLRGSKSPLLCLNYHTRELHGLSAPPFPHLQPEEVMPASPPTPRTQHSDKQRLSTQAGVIPLPCQGSGRGLPDNTGLPVGWPHMVTCRWEQKGPGREKEALTHLGHATNF